MRDLSEFSNPIYASESPEISKAHDSVLPVSRVTISQGLAVFPGSSRDRVLQLNSTDANFSTTVRIFPLSVVFLTGRSSGRLSLAQDRRRVGRLFVLGRR